MSPGHPQCIPSHTHYLLTELCGRSLMTLLCWEWHLIKRLHLRSIFAQFRKQLLKHLVSWCPGDCSMIDRFLGDVFGALSCMFRSTVLQCGARLLMHKKATGPCSQWCRFQNWRYLSVTSLIVDLWGYCVCCIRSGVTRCTLLMVLYLDRMCQCVVQAVLWVHIGIVMSRLDAEHLSTTRLLFFSLCFSRTILLIPYYYYY